LQASERRPGRRVARVFCLAHFFKGCQEFAHCGHYHPITVLATFALMFFLNVAFGQNFHSMSSRSAVWRWSRDALGYRGCRHRNVYRKLHENPQEDIAKLAAVAAVKSWPHVGVHPDQCVRFLPMMFVTGIAGSYLKIGFGGCRHTYISTIVAFTLLPMCIAKFGNRKRAPLKTTRPGSPQKSVRFSGQAYFGY